jgi:hypothetical protein
LEHERGSPRRAPLLLWLFRHRVGGLFLGRWSALEALACLGFQALGDQSQLKGSLGELTPDLPVGSAIALVEELPSFVAQLLG